MKTLGPALYLFFLALTVIALIVLNELGYGILAFIPGMIIAYLLMEKLSVIQ